MLGVDWNAWKRWAAPTLDCASFLFYWSVDYSFWVVWCRLWLQITTFSTGNRGKCPIGKSEHDIAFQTFQVTKEPFGYFSYRLCQIVWSSISYFVCKNSLISWKIYIRLKFLSFPTKVKKEKHKENGVPSVKDQSQGILVQDRFTEWI